MANSNVGLKNEPLGWVAPAAMLSARIASTPFGRRILRPDHAGSLRKCLAPGMRIASDRMIGK
jgi:hypothetical protein